MIGSCVGPGRLERAKPYSFAPYEGEAFLIAHRAARHTWRALIERTTDLDESWRAAMASSPRLETSADHQRRIALDEHLHHEWDRAAARGPVRTAEWLERIATAHIHECLPLRENPDEPQWSFETVLRWVERFEAFGCLHAEYDVEWRRVASDPNRPEVVARLALAAAWAAHGAVDPAHLVIFLNALLKANDLLQAQCTHGAARLGTSERRYALSALLIEERLVERIRHHAEGVLA